MHPRHFSVTRTARYFALGPEDGSATELWLGLHGYAQLAARFLRWLAPLDDGRTLVAAPEALSRFYLETGVDGRHGKAIGASWLTREDREADLRDHLRYLDLLLENLLAGSVTRPRVILLGFSQGVALAARWVAEGRVRPDMLMLWGAPPPPDVPPALLAERLEGRPLHLVAGDGDAYLPPGSIESTGAALRTAGAAVRVTRFTGGHEVNGKTLLSLAGRHPAVP